jgi:hypothetical protein
MSRSQKLLDHQVVLRALKLQNNYLRTLQKVSLQNNYKFTSSINL